jgi:hypothetical protein
MSLRFAVGLLAVVISQAPVLAQQGAPPPLPFPSYQGTPDDQKACQPAVFKFCQAAVPDQMRILQCLQANRPHIGKACQAVLASYGQ